MRWSDINKILVLAAAVNLFAVPWETFRCVVRTNLTAGGSESATVSTVVCRKDADGFSSRSAMLEPEERRFTAVVMGGVRTVVFPGKPAMTQSEEPGLMEALTSDQLSLSFFPDSTAQGTICKSIKSIHLFSEVPVDSICWSRKGAGAGQRDRLIIYDTLGVPLGTLLILYKALPAGDGYCTLPERVEYLSSDGTAKLTAEYGAYRINEPIPDSTFTLHDSP